MSLFISNGKMHDLLCLGLLALPGRNLGNFIDYFRLRRGFLSAQRLIYKIYGFGSTRSPTSVRDAAGEQEPPHFTTRCWVAEEAGVERVTK